MSYKLSILIGVYFLLCGCSGNEPKPSNIMSSISIEDNHYQIRKKLSIPKKHKNCKLLASGYLVCPKTKK